MESKKTKKVLITGVAGLLGCNLAKYLKYKDDKYKIIGIDNLSGGYLHNIDDGCVDHFYEYDLTDKKQVDEVFNKHKPDYVYHFAAYAAEGLSPFIRNFNYTQNLVAYSNVINATINTSVEKIIVASSMSVYGEGTPPFTERQQPAPEDPYAVAKWAMEQDVKLAQKQFGQRFSIVRPHNVIGKYQNIWDRYRNVIGIWIRQTMDGEPISIFGDGTQQRAFSDVKYYMKPFEQLMEVADEETINIGADKYYSINEAANIVKEVGEELGFEPTIKHYEKRNEVHKAYCCHEKAQKLLGFKDSTNFKNMVREMFVWAKELHPLPVKEMDYEIEKGIYSYWK